MHSLSLSPSYAAQTQTISLSLSLSRIHTHTSLTSRHLCPVNRALAAFSLAIPAAVSVPLNLSPALALARLHLSPHKHYQSLSRSYHHRSPAQDLLFLAPNSFTTAQQWGLNHTEVGGGGGSRAVVEWRGASKAVGSEGGGTSRRPTERWKGERERKSEDSGSEKEREATPLTGRCHSTESPLRSRGSLTPVAQSAWLDFRAVFHRSFRAEAPTWCST